MYHSVAQISLISVVLLSTNAQSLYNRRETPEFSLINVERPVNNGITGQREILIFEVPRLQVPHLAPHLISLEKVQNPAIGAPKSPAYPGYPQYPSSYPQSPYVAPTPAPSWNYQNPPQPYYVAVEDVRPAAPQSLSKHFSLFDVNLPAPPTIIVNSYPKRTRELDAHLPNPIRGNLEPAIDVRSSNTNQRVNSESLSSTTQARATTDSGVPVTQQNDPNRSFRSAEEEDPEIVFPQPSDGTDDSVEILAPFRSPRNIESSQSNVQTGYPVINSHEPVVNHLYRYVKRPVMIQNPKQYQSRQR